MIPENFGRSSSGEFGVAADYPDDGRLVVAACRGSTDVGPPHVVKVWEVATGLEVWESPEFPCGISEVVFAPGGRCLAVALDDATTVLFDVPMRPLALDPSWRTLSVLALARGVRAESAFDRMPILADALRDAGCADPDVLAHCLASAPPARATWVIDLVLGGP